MTESQNAQDILERLRKLEETQHEILRKLDALQSSTIPTNENGIHKISKARTVFFLNDLMPQVYLTLVSVLEGVVLAILIDKVQNNLLVNNALTYLFAISSLLIVVAFWYSYLGAILDGKWPFRFVDTFLFFLSATFQALSVYNCDTPWRWCFFTGLMCLVIAGIYLRQGWLLRQLQDRQLFEDERELKRRLTTVKVITAFFIIGAVLSFFFVFVTQSNPESFIAPVLAVGLPVAYILFSIKNHSNFGIDAIG